MFVPEFHGPREKMMRCGPLAEIPNELRSHWNVTTARAPTDALSTTRLASERALTPKEKVVSPRHVVSDGKEPVGCVQATATPAMDEAARPKAMYSPVPDPLSVTLILVPSIVHEMSRAPPRTLTLPVVVGAGAVVVGVAVVSVLVAVAAVVSVLVGACVLAVAVVVAVLVGACVLAVAVVVSVLVGVAVVDGMVVADAGAIVVVVGGSVNATVVEPRAVC